MLAFTEATSYGRNPISITLSSKVFDLASKEKLAEHGEGFIDGKTTLSWGDDYQVVIHRGSDDAPEYSIEYAP